YRGIETGIQRGEFTQGEVRLEAGGHRATVFAHGLERREGTESTECSSPDHPKVGKEMGILRLASDATIGAGASNGQGRWSIRRDRRTGADLQPTTDLERPALADPHGPARRHPKYDAQVLFLDFDQPLVLDLRAEDSCPGHRAGQDSDDSVG